MPLTVTRHPELESVAGVYRHTVTEIAFPNPYVAGGISLTLAQLGLSHTLRSVFIEPFTDGKRFVYDRTNKKVMVFTGGAESGAVDLTAVTGVRVIAEGR